MLGGDGDDHMKGGDEWTAFQQLTGGAGDDWVKGGDDGATQDLHGDWQNFQKKNKEQGYKPGALGGKDKIWGGNRLSGNQIISGGGNDDIIYSGNEVAGLLQVWGDM